VLNSVANYSVVLLLAFCCWIVAAVVYMAITEYAGETQVGEMVFPRRCNIRWLKTDALFRRFIIVRVFLISSGLAIPYFILFATQPIETESNRCENWTSLTAFVGGSGVARLISGGFWGRFADTSSRKLMLVCAALAVFCVVVPPVFPITGIL